MSFKSGVIERIFIGCALISAFIGSGCQSSPPDNPVNDSSWKIIGPGGGGSQFHATVSPHDPDIALVSCDMTGAYVTLDAGKSWRMFNLRSTIRFFEFDPVDPSIIYAYSIGLWKSVDQGSTWELIFPPPDNVTGIEKLGDHASERLKTSTESGQISALAVDPKRNQTIYGAFDQNGVFHLSLSQDSGKTWERMVDLPERISRILVDPKSPLDDRTFFLVGQERVCRIRNGKLELFDPPGGIRQLYDVSGGFSDSSSDPVLYAVAKTDSDDRFTASGLLISGDGGRSWKQAGGINFGCQAENVLFSAVGSALYSPEVAYLSYEAKCADDQFFGVAKTTDSGQSWSVAIRDSNEKPSARIREGWISKRFGRGWGANPFSLGVAPNNPDVCYGTDWGRTMRTLDGLETWEAVYTKEANPGRWTSIGLDVTTTYGVHFDPFHKNRIFITYTDIGLFRSEDGGISWMSSTEQGVPRRWVNTTYWMEFDPEVEGRVWAVASGIHDLPRPKMWRNQPVSNYNGGILLSEDGGISWIPAEGIPQTAATHIILDPDSPVNARILYVAGFGTGVFKSMDGGKSWELRNRGLPEKEPFAWQLTRDNQGALYLVIARRSTDDSIGSPLDGSLYRSEDGAESWEKVELPPGLNGPNGLKVDSSDSSRLYLASWARNTLEEEKHGGVYISEDRGASWRKVLREDQHIYDVTIDPQNPSRLYACGFNSSVWRSDDRGETWWRLKGYNFKWGHRVIPDPFDHEKIYVTTFGGSVWYGPAEGDPGAVEDIITPAVAY